MVTDELPWPGSDEAIALGCTCAGYAGKDAGTARSPTHPRTVINPHCFVHSAITVLRYGGVIDREDA